MRSSVAGGVCTLAQVFVRSTEFGDLVKGWSNPMCWLCLLKPFAIILFICISSSNRQQVNTFLTIGSLTLFMMVEIFRPAMYASMLDTTERMFNMIGWALLFCGVALEIEIAGRSDKDAADPEHEQSVLIC